ncbi:ribonuclease T2 family protein [Nitratifractor salsuginis]|uniref:Ribonuclease T2 n=1 Tax=Nitratifractor salsuginis (strain DSM 16511 / JCM 12458 / E9I37-1) TaxID=749222 RepID=E6X2D5_NITSE|nr:ribonuclease T(2) [Nitratifractor salsuginis]ADV46070.1 ribonuclease T2 [Nitratifractor salsuginis DSM 16511]
MRYLFRTVLILAGVLLSISSLEARYQAHSTASCPAWNDLAHHRNRGSLNLEPGKSYNVLRRHKGQYLIKLEAPFPTQRWVDEKCLSRDAKPGIHTGSSEKAYTQSSLHSLLVMSWHNSFCETHPNRKECRPRNNRAANHLVLHGLWPQPRNRAYCAVPERLKMLDKRHQWRALSAIDYPPRLRQLMERYFPGALSGLDRHEWVKHGSCYGKDPVNYFNDALSLTAQVDRSMVGEYLRANIGQRVRLSTLRRLFARSFGPGNGPKLAMNCRNGLLSELSISLRGKGDKLPELLKGAPALHSRCVEGIVDGPGLFHRH